MTCLKLDNPYDLYVEKALVFISENCELYFCKDVNVTNKKLKLGKLSFNSILFDLEISLFINQGRDCILTENENKFYDNQYHTINEDKELEHEQEKKTYKPFYLKYYAALIINLQKIFSFEKYLETAEVSDYKLDRTNFKLGQVFSDAQGKKLDIYLCVTVDLKVNLKRETRRIEKNSFTIQNFSKTVSDKLEKLLIDFETNEQFTSNAIRIGEYFYPRNIISSPINYQDREFREGVYYKELIPSENIFYSEILEIRILSGYLILNETHIPFNVSLECASEKYFEWENENEVYLQKLEKGTGFSRDELHMSFEKSKIIEFRNTNLKQIVPKMIKVITKDLIVSDILGVDLNRNSSSGFFHKKTKELNYQFFQLEINLNIN